jgi:branched-chain amino acid transport system ATP-binding protein
MAELAVEHLSLQFGGLAVLTDVSLSVEAGELLALIGPNGAGKTSVLNCISGIYRGQGAIRLRGRDINGRPAHEIASLGIARTFQHGEVFPQMTVLENLLTGRHARIATNVLAEMFFLPGVRREELRHREAVEKLLAFVGLSQYRTRRSERCRLGCRSWSVSRGRWHSSQFCYCSTNRRPASTAPNARISPASFCASRTSSASP